MVAKLTGLIFRPVTLFIVKTARSTDYDPLSTLASETLPLDVDLWVQTAVQRQQEMMNKDGLQEDMSQTFAEGTLAYDAETDEEVDFLFWISFFLRILPL